MPTIEMCGSFVQLFLLNTRVRWEDLYRFIQEIRVSPEKMISKTKKYKLWSIQFNFIQFQMGSSWVVKKADATQTKAPNGTRHLLHAMLICGR